MDINFINYLMSRGINVERYKEASISEQGQILSAYAYELQQLRAPPQPGTQLWNWISLIFSNKVIVILLIPNAAAEARGITEDILYI